MKRIPLGRIRPRKLKYRAQPTMVDGHRFDSKGEAERYAELCALERAGLISGLRLQAPFPITVNGITVARYVADFVYVENSAEVVEDFKSPATAKNPTYRLKKKLVEAIYGIAIRETGINRTLRAREHSRKKPVA